MSKFKFNPDKDVDSSGHTNAVRVQDADMCVRLHAGLRPTEKLEDSSAYDLISDIYHLCDKEGWDVGEVLANANRQWMEER